MVRGAVVFEAATVIDSVAVAVCCGELLSLTATVKLAVPLALGLPEMTPELDNVSPVGRLPDAIDQL